MSAPTHEQRVVLGHFEGHHPYGEQPSGWAGKLLELIAASDPANLGLLQAQYPQWVRAFTLWQVAGIDGLVDGDLMVEPAPDFRQEGTAQYTVSTVDGRTVLRVAGPAPAAMVTPGVGHVWAAARLTPGGVVLLCGQLMREARVESLVRTGDTMFAVYTDADVTDDGLVEG